MALKDVHVIDAVGTDAATGIVVLTLVDAWDPKSFEQVETRTAPVDANGKRKLFIQ